MYTLGRFAADLQIMSLHIYSDPSVLYVRGESWLMTSAAALWRTFANGKKGNDLLWAAWADCIVGYFLIGELIYHKNDSLFMNGFSLTIKDGRWRRVEAETVSARKSRRRMPSLVR